MELTSPGKLKETESGQVRLSLVAKLHSLTWDACGAGVVVTETGDDDDPNLPSPAGTAIAMTMMQMAMRPTTKIMRLRRLFIQEC